MALNVAPTNRLTGHSAALAINDQSDIVGYYEYRVNATQDGYGHAAYWRQSACALIPPVPAVARCPLELVDVHPASGVPVDTEAVDVNERRQILLQSGQTWVLEHRGYLLQPRDPADRFSPFTRHDLTPSVGWIDPNRLNNAGLVVGRYREFVGGEHPFLFDGIPTLSDAALTSGWPGPVLSAQFRAVNDRGVIAGLYATNSADGLRRRAFLQYPDGTVTQLEDPFVALSGLDGINNRGQLVGSEYANRAVLYTDGAWFLLNDLLTGPVGPNVLTAHAINDGGQIVGMAIIPLVGMRACLLTPDLPGNHPPVANPDALALPARGPALIPASALLANDSDSDGDRLQLEAVLGGGIGDATLAGGHVRRSGDAILYTPPLATVAGDAFEYVVNDGGGERATARVTVTLVPPDPAIPVLINPPQLTPDGGVLLSGQAPPGSVVTIYNMTAIDDALPLRAAVLEVDATGRWSIVLPATEGARRRFYSVDVQVPS